MTTLRSRHTLVACVLALCAWPAAHAQTAADLRNDAATPADVLTYGMGYANQRYSPLKRIDKLRRQCVEGGAPAGRVAGPDVPPLQVRSAEGLEGRVPARSGLEGRTALCTPQPGAALCRHACPR